jgi:hypothetical protein
MAKCVDIGRDPSSSVQVVNEQEREHVYGYVQLERGYSSAESRQAKEFRESVAAFRR